MAQSSTSLRGMVFAALMAAFTAAGAYIVIPIGPVPIVLQNLFVLLAGLLLGSRGALTSMTVYLLAGACGLPVFAGGTGGIGRLVGPTGGYLIGFAVAAFVIGWIVETGKGGVLLDVLALVCGTLIIYVLGVYWLKLATAMSWNKALAAGMLPFLPGDTVKIAVAVPIARILRPIVSGKTVPVQVVG
jgi:biotin transport system substrate-specific component